MLQTICPGKHHSTQVQLLFTTGEGSPVQSTLYTALLRSIMVKLQKKKSSMQRRKVAYNDATRIFLKIPRGGRASQMLVTAGVSTCLLRNRMFKFMKRLEESGNSIIVVLVDPTLSCARNTASLS